jgi:tetratricopeptide (TPR) repeat protein
MTFLKCFPISHQSKTPLLAVLWALMLLSLVVRAQPSNNLESMFAEPFPLVPAALGSYTFPVSTSSPEAQAYFDQGMQLMFAYGKYEAIRSFREAQTRDPDCAMCYWGESWSWGSYLNAPMSEADAAYAYSALQKAIAFRPNASQKEQAYIDALSKRYVADYVFEQRRVQDETYAEAMKILADSYPDDLDAVTLYADALFLLEERRGYRDLANPNVIRIHSILEGVLERDVQHPFACHLYIHATESTTEPEKAEICTQFMGNVIPGASHLNHMPSHTWNEIGRWGDSVRANLQAWHTDQKAAFGEGIAIYPTHNLQMLLFAASMDGQGAIAMQAGKDLSVLNGNSLFQLLTLLRFGRFDEILQVTERPEADYPAGVWDFSQGYALLKTGETAFAQAHLARLSSIAETTEARFRFDPASLLLSVMKEILQGEIEWNEGNLRRAIRTFERAVEFEDALGYDEPEPLPFAARHWLGAALLEAERYRDAEQVYREELVDHPHNGWSLFGLQQALNAQNKTDTEVDQDFEESWARADVWIRSSRY